MKSYHLKFGQLLAALALWASPAAAEDLNLAQAVELGLENSHSIRAVDERVQARQFDAAYNESQLKLQVQLNASAEYSHSRSESAGDLTKTDSWPLRSSASASYPLYTTKILQQLSLDASELARAKLERRQTWLQVVNQVFNYYLDILELHDGIDLQRSQLETLGNRQRNVQLRLDNGVGSRLDLIEIEADLVVGEASLLELEAQLGANYSALEQITGVSIERLYALRADLQLPEPISSEVGYWREAGLRANVDLLLTRQSLTSAQEQARLVEKSYLPDLSAFASFDPGMNYQSGEFRENTSASLGLSFSYQLYDSGQKRADVARALAQVRELEQSLSAQQQELDISVNQLVQTLNAQQDVVAARVRSAGVAEEKLRATQISYENGISALEDLLSAQSEQQEADNAYNSSVYSYLRNYFELLELSGSINLERLELFYDLLAS